MNEYRARLVWSVCQMLGIKASRVLIESYLAVFAELTDEEFARGLSQAVKSISNNYPHLPSPKSIFDNARGTTETYLEHEANFAWNTVARAISSLGGYVGIDCDDKSILAALAAVGGWVRICEAPIDELPFIRRDFLRAYKSYRREPPPDSICRPLPGRTAEVRMVLAETSNPGRRIPAGNDDSLSLDRYDEP